MAVITPENPTWEDVTQAIRKLREWLLFNEALDGQMHPMEEEYMLLVVNALADALCYSKLAHYHHMQGT
jgi:hypothetical protein